MENNLHHALDVSLGEDRGCMHKGHAAESFSRIRRIALNLPPAETTKKRGLTGSRLTAAWDHDYLLKLLTGWKAFALSCRRKRAASVVLRP